MSCRNPVWISVRETSQPFYHASVNNFSHHVLPISFSVSALPHPFVFRCFCLSLNLPSSTCSPVPVPCLESIWCSFRVCVCIKDALVFFLSYLSSSVSHRTVWERTSIPRTKRVLDQPQSQKAAKNLMCFRAICFKMLPSHWRILKRELNCPIMIVIKMQSRNANWLRSQNLPQHHSNSKFNMSLPFEKAQQEQQSSSSGQQSGKWTSARVPFVLFKRKGKVWKTFASVWEKMSRLRRARHVSRGGYWSAVVFIFYFLASNSIKSVR